MSETRPVGSKAGEVKTVSVVLETLEHDVADPVIGVSVRGVSRNRNINSLLTSKLKVKHSNAFKLNFAFSRDRDLGDLTNLGELVELEKLKNESDYIISFLPMNSVLRRLRGEDKHGHKSIARCRVRDKFETYRLRVVGALYADCPSLPPALFQAALDYMGNEASAKRLLTEPHWMLNGQSLAELSQTPEGLQRAIEMIEDARVGNPI